MSAAVNGNDDDDPRKQRGDRYEELEIESYEYINAEDDEYHTVFYFISDDAESHGWIESKSTIDVEAWR